MFRFSATLFLMAPLTLSLVACNCDDHRTVRANGPDVTETRFVADLTRLRVSGSTEVYLTQGTTPALRVEAPRNVLDVLLTEAVSGELRIGPRENLKLRLQHPVRVYLTLPRLTALQGSGSSRFYGSAPWSVADLTLTLSGASSADLNLTATGPLRTDASGASRLTLRGTGGLHTVRLSGASSFEGFALAATDCDVDASGASTARLTVTNTLAVRASGASEVYYTGNPTLTVRDISGGSRLVKVQ